MSAPSSTKNSTSSMLKSKMSLEKLKQRVEASMHFRFSDSIFRNPTNNKNLLTNVRKSQHNENSGKLI